jgi:hypothetical protein
MFGFAHVIRFSLEIGVIRNISSGLYNFNGHVFTRLFVAAPVNLCKSSFADFYPGQVIIPIVDA